MSGNNANKMNVSYGARVLLKDADFQRTSGDAIETKYQGRVMIWTGNTFADSQPYDTQQNGERAHVFKLDVTVQDEAGAPIEDAVVELRQFDGKEQFTFVTNAAGKLHAIHNLEGAFLTHRSYYTNTASEVWSSASKPHSYNVFKNGCVSEAGTVIMDADKSVTVKLKAIRPDNFSASQAVSL